MNKRSIATTLMTTILIVSPIAEAKRVGGGKSYGNSRTTHSSSHNSSSSNQNRQASPSAQPQRSGIGAGSMVAAGVAGAAAGYMLGHSNDAQAQQGTTVTDPSNVSNQQQTSANTGFPIFWVILIAIAGFFIFRRFSAKKAAANANPFAPNHTTRENFNSSIFDRNTSTHGHSTTTNTSPTSQSNTNVFGQTVSSVASGAAYSTSSNQLPDGTEPAAFLRQARAKFLHLQSMNHASNIEEIRRYFTPDMYAAIREEILSNDELAEFPQLTAQVIASGNEHGQYFASVQFNGMVSESLNAQPVPFSEVWQFVKLPHTNEWLVDGIQQR